MIILSGVEPISNSFLAVVTSAVDDDKAAQEVPPAAGKDASASDAIGSPDHRADEDGGREENNKHATKVEKVDTETLNLIG